MSWCATLFGRNAVGAAINARGISARWVLTGVDQHLRFAAHNRPHCVLPCVRTFVQAGGVLGRRGVMEVLCAFRLADNDAFEYVDRDRTWRRMIRSITI